MSSQPSFFFADAPSNGISLLFFAWTYILCKKLLEMQGVAMRYSTGNEGPETTSTRSFLDIDLGVASEAEAWWWNALLAPGRG